MNHTEAILCPWCKRQSHVSVASECPNCGGPIVLASHRAHPDAPPAPPRRIPSQYRSRITGFLSSFLMLFGSIWGVVGTIFFVVGIFLLMVFALLGGIFTAIGGIFGGIGWYLVYRGRREALDRLALFENGIAVQGQLVSVFRDASYRKNRQYAWAVEYVYEVEGERYGDTVHGFDPVLSTRKAGEPIWVVVDPQDRSKSELWPPIG